MKALANLPPGVTDTDIEAAAGVTPRKRRPRVPMADKLAAARAAGYAAGEDSARLAPGSGVVIAFGSGVMLAAAFLAGALIF